MGPAKQTLVVVAFTLVSCSSQLIPAATPTTDSTVLHVYATTPVIPLVRELTTTYNQYFPSISFDVTVGNYETIVEQVEAEEERYFITNHLPDDRFWAALIGQDGIAVIVHPDTMMTSLTTDQLREIYQGRVVNWAELGGVNLPVEVVSREDGSGTRAEFERLVIGQRRTTRSARIAPSSAAMITTVAATPGSIGYVSMSYLSPQIQAVAINGISPQLAHVADNTYPLRSNLYIAGADEPKEGPLRAFIGWVQSPEGQAIVARHYAPLLP